MITINGHHNFSVAQLRQLLGMGPSSDEAVIRQVERLCKAIGVGYCVPVIDERDDR